jgi:hypothetical protein
VSTPNDALRRARESRPSSRLPGCPMSRDELATLVNAWLRRETGEIYALDERAIGKWERGKVKRPSAPYRAALRAVLRSTTIGNSASLICPSHPFRCP